MAAFDRRTIVGGAAATTLTGSMDSSVLSASLNAATGWPTGSVGEWGIVIGRGTATEEKVLVTSRSGVVLTLASGGRGIDGTSAMSHAVGDTVEVCVLARDLDEANDHISDPTYDHHTQYLTEARHETEHASTTWTPAYTNMTIGNATVVARYSKVEKWVTLRLSIVIGSTTSITGNIAISLPVTAHASGYQAGHAVALDTTSPTVDGRLSGGVLVAPSGTTLTIDNNLGSLWDEDSPITWAAGDVLSVQITYEAAS